MRQTLEKALEKISELENRIARLERIVIGSSGLAANLRAPARAGQQPGDSGTAFPRLNAELVEARKRMAPGLKTIQIKSAIETTFPNIAENLTLVWGNPECEDYLSKLTINSRGSRQGFSLDVMGELMLLMSIAEREHADAWSDPAKP